MIQKRHMRRITSFIAASSLALSSMLPLTMGRAGADQLTTRSLTISTATASATNVTYTFAFNLNFSGGTSNVGSVEIDFCTTPLGACADPGINVASVASGDILTQTIDGSPAGFTVGTNTSQLIQLTRTAASENDGDAVVLTFDNIDNPSNNTQTPAGNNTFFARVSVYSDNGYSTLVSDGTVAAAIVPLLTINARVQEILHFCVGSLIDAGTYTGTDDCATVAGTTSTVDLGPVDSTGITTSPDDDGNDRDGVLMMRTNAAGGSISYRSVINGSGTSGALKKAADTCAVAAVSTSDGCFNYATTTGGDGTLGTGIEGFGMWLSNYDAASASATTNLVASAPYGTTSDYVWQGDPTAVTQIASQTNGVDDEAFRIRFGARTVLTTQTGNYSTAADFIAVATY